MVVREPGGRIDAWRPSPDRPTLVGRTRTMPGYGLTVSRRPRLRRMPSPGTSTCILTTFNGRLSTELAIPHCAAHPADIVLALEETIHQLTD